MRAEVITLRDGAAKSPAIAGFTGVVLADGADERFAGMDRGWIQVGGRPLIKRVFEQLVLQVKRILIVARRNESLYATWGYPVISTGGDALSALVDALSAIETTHALFVPADAARLPTDLGSRLWQAHVQHGAAPCFVRGADGAIPACCLVAKSERASAEKALAAGSTLSGWLAARKAVEVDFTAWPAAFWGIASPAEIAPLESALRR